MVQVLLLAGECKYVCAEFKGWYVLERVGVLTDQVVSGPSASAQVATDEALLVDLEPGEALLVDLGAVTGAAGHVVNDWALV